MIDPDHGPTLPGRILTALLVAVVSVPAVWAIFEWGRWPFRGFVP